MCMMWFMNIKPVVFTFCLWPLNLSITLNEIKLLRHLYYIIELEFCNLQLLVSFSFYYLGSLYKIISID